MDYLAKQAPIVLAFENVKNYIIIKFTFTACLPKIRKINLNKNLCNFLTSYLFRKVQTKTKSVYIPALFQLSLSCHQLFPVQSLFYSALQYFFWYLPFWLVKKIQWDFCWHLKKFVINSIINLKVHKHRGNDKSYITMFSNMNRVLMNSWL